MNLARSLKRIVITMVLAAGIVALLASVLLPLYPSRGPGHGISRVRVEIASLAMAARSYEIVYNTWPISNNIEGLVNGDDFTFGTLGIPALTIVTNLNGYQANNAELVSILCDTTRYRDGRDTPNAGHIRNAQQHVFLNALQVADTKSPGIGLDGVYRDPWGNPYIITVDLNGNGRCRDAFYRLASVSENGSGTDGLEGLVRLTLPPYKAVEARDSFEVNAQVVIWSFGPDGKADPKKKANEGVNKDNILSWQ